MTTKLMLAAASALSLSFAGAPGTAATHLPHQKGPISGKPAQPQMIRNLLCAVNFGPGQLNVSGLRLTNTTGTTLAAGTRVNLSILFADGTVRTESFLMGQPLAPGAAVDYLVHGKVRRCGAWVNLAAKLGVPPKTPVVR